MLFVEINPHERNIAIRQTLYSLFPYRNCFSTGVNPDISYVCFPVGVFGGFSGDLGFFRFNERFSCGFDTIPPFPHRKLTPFFK